MEEIKRRIQHINTTDYVTARDLKYVLCYTFVGLVSKSNSRPPLTMLEPMAKEIFDGCK